ncbi:MAG: SUMF1/EgtB/PvdO family nonheme iron enzyme [Mucinivorans sp.]
MKKLLCLALALALSTSLYAKKTPKADPTPAPPISWAEQAVAAKEAVAKSMPASLPIATQVMKKGMAPEEINVDLTGLKELVLVTDATADGTDFDHAVWGDAYFVRADGSKVGLDKIDYKIRRITGNWWSVNQNFSGKPLSVGLKNFKCGVIAHANGLLVIDLTKDKFVKFEGFAGIDNGSNRNGSAIFRVSATSGIEESKALCEAVPEINVNLVPYLRGNLDAWLTTPNLSIEQSSISALLRQIDDRTYFNTQIEKIASMEKGKPQTVAYLEMIAQMGQVVALQNDLTWLNPTAVNDAYADFSAVKGYDKTKWSAKIDQFNKLITASNNFKGIYSADSKTIKDLSTAIALRREILMSNPALDFDKIVVTRYNLGDNARSAMAPDMGTQPNNWSSQLSSQRTGFDAQIVELTDIRSDKPKERLVYKPEKGNVVTDVQLHWDADRMIFTSNDKHKHYQIYEVALEGGEAKQMTNIPESDLEFFDAAYLPNGKLLVTSNVGYSGVPCVNGSDAVGSFSLYDPKTGQMRRLTFDQDNVWNPSVMSDGKILYTRWEYTDLMHYYARINFTMNPDGTEQKALFGSGAMFPNSTFDMQQIPGTPNSFIGVISGHHGIARSGRLIIFDPQKARKGVEGMVQEVPYSKREIIPLVKDQLVNGVWPQFIKPHPINDKYFLVAAKMTPTSLWGVYLIDVYDNVTLVAQVEGAGLINPIPVFKKKTPPIVPERVPMDLKDAPKTATVFIQDIYEGEGLIGVPRGTVKALRVLSFEFAYLHSLSDHVAQGVQSGWDIKRELGIVPIEADGSALFTIPANTTISLQPLDSTGAAIQLMRSWFVGMPGETVSCVGCHEDQNMIAMPKRVMASQMKPRTIAEPEGGVRPFKFELEVQPILDRACVACHNGKDLKGGIDYTGGRMEVIEDWAGKREFSKSYLAFHPYFYRQGPEAEMAVLNPYEYNVSNSEMIQMLRKGHHGVELTPYEWNRLITWVDFNLPYNSSFPASPYEVINTGETIDQKARRIELAEKYSGAPIYWEKEIEAYTKYLKNKGEIKPTMPTQAATKNQKIAKVKGWPFTQDQAAAMVSGKEIKKIDLGNGQTLDFVYVPAGTFVNGNGEKVQIKKAFYMSATELNNAQVRAILPYHDSRYIGQQWKDHTTPGYFVDSAHLAATKISWNEAKKYADLLSTKTGLKVALPSANEWEWAARSGSATDFWFGTTHTDFSKYENFADDELGKMAVSGIDPKPMSRNDSWFKYQAYIPKEWSVNDGNMLMTAPGSYQANPWGLYDMHGNVAEWTRDDYGQGSLDKIVVGASWYDRPKRGAASARRHFLPWHQVWNVGMRLVIEE